MYLSLEVFRRNGRVDSLVAARGENNTAPPPQPVAQKKGTNEIMSRTGLWINHQRLANYATYNEA